MEGKRKRGAPGTCPWPRSAAPRVRRASRLRLRRRRRHQIRMPWRPAIKGKGREVEKRIRVAGIREGRKTREVYTKAERGDWSERKFGKKREGNGRGQWEWTGFS